MGHEDEATTYQLYIDMARVLMFVHKGHALDMFRAPDLSVSGFIDQLKPVDRNKLVENGSE